MKVALAFDAAGRGRPVVLVHGWLSSRRVFGYQLHGLSEACHVIAVDLPGYGASGWDPSRAWLDQAVDGVAAICADLSQAPVVVGWSLGASVARLAVERVAGAKLVVVGASESGPSDAVADAMLHRLLRDFPRYARAMARSFTFAASSETEEWLFQMAVATPVDAALASAPRQVALPPLPGDALIVHGVHDQIARAEQWAGWAEQVRPFSQSGHAPFLDEKEAFNQALLDWTVRV